MVQGSTGGKPDTYSVIAHVVVCWGRGAAAWRLEHHACVSGAWTQWTGLQLRESTGGEGQATRQAGATSLGTVDCAAGMRAEAAH